MLEIDGASNNGVEQVRELRENVRFLPSHGKYRIYLIDEVHMLSNAAFNALHGHNLAAAKDARIRQLEERVETLREAGDALAYCHRHARAISREEVMDAMREWQEASNHG